MEGNLHQKIKRAHQSQLCSGYDWGISEGTQIVKKRRNYMGKSVDYYFFKARFKMKSFPKKSSSDISFNQILHTQNVKPQFCFIIIFVAHVHGIKNKGRQAFELEET